MSASRNGKPRTRYGSGLTVRPRWRLPPSNARDSKLERALIVAFALAELLVEGGERVGIPGLMNPTASRSVIDKMAQAMLHDDAARLEPAAVLRAVVAGGDRGAVGLLVADRGHSRHAGRAVVVGAHGTLVQIVDPAEETFPYSGRVEFIEPEGFGTHHRRPRRDLGPRLCRAGQTASRPDPRRDQQARLAVHDPYHQPLGCRTAAVPAWRHDGEQGRRARCNVKAGRSA